MLEQKLQKLKAILAKEKQKIKDSGHQPLPSFPLQLKLDLENP